MTAAPSNLAGGLARRDRAVILAGLAVLTALSWAYMLWLDRDVDGMSAMCMANMRGWGAMDFLLMFAMWAVMMVAMMLPSAAPMILTFARVSGLRREQSRPYVPASVFLAGYLAAWTGFSLLATLAQAGLHKAALLSSMMVASSTALGGGLLLAAGAFQWTPWKNACLRHCRSPLSLILHDWREGYRGAFRMGLQHGWYCVACCWLLMALLFVAGVMNLLWVAAIAGFVLLEKIGPAGPWLARAAGVLMAGWGAWMIAKIVI